MFACVSEGRSFSCAVPASPEIVIPRPREPRLAEVSATRDLGVAFASFHLEPVQDHQNQDSSLALTRWLARTALGMTKIRNFSAQLKLRPSETGSS
jgi:hypothetical protein